MENDLKYCEYCLKYLEISKFLELNAHTQTGVGYAEENTRIYNPDREIGIGF